MSRASQPSASPGRHRGYGQRRVRDHRAGRRRRPTAGGCATLGLPNTWHVAGRLSLGSARATSCPTSSVCWAITGGGLLASQNGGATG